MGRCYLPRHKAIRGARGHSRKRGKNIDIVLRREDGKIEIYKEEEE